MPATRSKRTSRAYEVVVKREESPPAPVAVFTPEQLYALIRRIPEGKVASYGDLAKLLGCPKHSRLVGSTLKVLPRHLSSPTLPQAAPEPAADDDDEPLPEPDPNPDFVPWHRVVSSTGVISPRGGGLAPVLRQADFLRAEGVEVMDGPRAGGRRDGGNGAPGGGGVDAFGLGGIDGGRVSMAEYRWDGR